MGYSMNKSLSECFTEFNSEANVEKQKENVEQHFRQNGASKIWEHYPIDVMPGLTWFEEHNLCKIEEMEKVVPLGHTKVVCKIKCAYLTQAGQRYLKSDSTALRWIISQIGYDNYQLALWISGWIASIIASFIMGKII